MHAAKPASLQTAQRQAYRVFARCPRSPAGPSRRGGGSHCVPFTARTVSRSWSTSNRRILPSPLRSGGYRPGSICNRHHTRYPRLAVAPSAIRHPQRPQQPQHPCRPCAQSPASSARLVSSLLLPCLPFATRPAQHCSNAPWCGAAAEETARLVPPMTFLRKDAAIAFHARPCRIIQHTGPHGATRPGRGVCHRRDPLRYVLPLPCEFIDTALVTPPTSCSQNLSQTRKCPILVWSVIPWLLGLLIISSPSEAYLKSWRYPGEDPMSRDRIDRTIPPTSVHQGATW